MSVAVRRSGRRGWFIINPFYGKHNHWVIIIHYFECPHRKTGCWCRQTFVIEWLRFSCENIEIPGELRGQGGKSNIKTKPTELPKTGSIFFWCGHSMGYVTKWIDEGFVKVYLLGYCLGIQVKSMFPFYIFAKYLEGFEFWFGVSITTGHNAYGSQCLRATMT